MRKNSAHPSGFHNRPAGKALLAAGAGVLLLAGAGGTFALWSAEGSATPGTITDGELSLAVAPGTWSNDGEPVTDISAFRMVPGDTLTFSTSVTPTIVGDNLEATLTSSLPQGIEDHWTVQASMTGGDGVLTAADSGLSYPVTVAVTLPEQSGDESQLATLDLAALTFTLNQVSPTAD